ncbi:hypothetical protein AJ88_01525 [Mesorhizobium amorphae CCBAU 01583]|nr:hypothetical protein AJ88_01525 [Mesorhizobium amorphae CCBAU 01583]
MADLTPPVALAAFAAAPMAKESGLKIGVQATKLAIAGFVVPFMAVYTPALMLQDAGPLAAQFGYPVEVAYVVVKACMGIVLWGAAAVGFLVRRMVWWERLVAFAAGVLLVAAFRSPTRPAGRSLCCGSAGMSGARARRSPPHEPLHPRRRQDGQARCRRLHPVLDALGGKDALAGRLDRAAIRAAGRRSTRQRVRRRHGAARGFGIAGRLVDLHARGRATAAPRARRVRRDRRRLDAVHGSGLPRTWQGGWRHDRAGIVRQTMIPNSFSRQPAKPFDNNRYLAGARPSQQSTSRSE